MWKHEKCYRRVRVFFDIWGVDFSEKKILGNDIDNKYTIEMTVNNQIVNTLKEHY